MSHEQLIIKYDGEDLEHHKMDLSSVVDSLSGLNTLLNEVNAIVNGSSDGVEIKVKAFNPGSFEYILDVVQNPQEHINILSTIGLVGASGAATLMSVLEAINSRKIERISFAIDGDCLIFLKDQEEPIKAPSYFKTMLTSSGVRNAISKLIHAPLTKEGVETFGIYKPVGGENQRETIVSIEKEQSAAFKKPYRLVESKQSTKVPHKEAIITFETVKKDSKNWRIYFQDEQVSAVMEDKDFINSLLSGNEADIFSSAYSADVTVEENAYNPLDKTYIVDKVHGVLA